MEILDANMRLLDYVSKELASRLYPWEKKLQKQYSDLAKKRNENVKQEIIDRLKRKYKCRVTEENFERKYIKRLSIKMDKNDHYSHMIYLDKKKFVVKFSNKVEVTTGIDEKGRNKAIITIG